MNAPPSPVLSVEEARQLRASGQWQALVERALPLPDDELLREPELAFLLAVGCRRTGRTARALELLAGVEPEARRRADRRLLAEAVNLAGIALWESGRAAEAEARFGELLESAAEWGDEEATARARSLASSFSETTKISDRANAVRWRSWSSPCSACW